jgi:hypothetical protein
MALNNHVPKHVGPNKRSLCCVDSALHTCVAARVDDVTSVENHHSHSCDFALLYTLAHKNFVQAMADVSRVNLARATARSYSHTVTSGMTLMGMTYVTSEQHSSGTQAKRPERVGLQATL